MDGNLPAALEDHSVRDGKGEPDGCRLAASRHQQDGQERKEMLHHRVISFIR
jgi:hypothetical protein